MIISVQGTGFGRRLSGGGTSDSGLGRSESELNILVIKVVITT